jgi:hypothetical protein
MARISTGKNSKQDYQTPKALIESVEKRFGKITLDLAARSYNKVCDNYLAPCTGPEGPLSLDKEAYGIDSFDHDWAELYKKLGGNFWLNCEFGDIGKWSARCALEANKGAQILLLIPYGTTKAFMANVVGKANLYLLEGRLQFIAGESFPKDCVIAHYGPAPDGGICFWDWKNDKITHVFNYNYWYLYPLGSKD